MSEKQCQCGSTDPYKHATGCVCVHDTLARSCDLCFKDWELTTLRQQLAAAARECEAWRGRPAGLRSSAYFPRCPEYAAGPCDCSQCRWAAQCSGARAATDALIPDLTTILKQESKP